MDKLRYWHMSGAGNDFVVMDVRGQALDLEQTAMTLCREVGADGFLALDESLWADFRLHFYNPSGLRGEMCGNGSRCICRFAYDLGIAGDSMVLQTDAGPVYGWRIAEDRYRVKLNLPSCVDLQGPEDSAYAELGDPGIPHAVVKVPSLSWKEKETFRAQGQRLRCHPAFPKGANVSFYCMLNDGSARVLTYERGVEDFTLACGTGCGTIASVLYLQNALPGQTLLCRNPGGDLLLTVDGTEGQIQGLYLEGPVEILKKA